MPSPTSDWDMVDQASLESFPASDPPARGSFRAAASESTVGLPDDLVAPRRRARLARAAIAAGLAVGGLILFGLTRRRR